MEYYSGSPVYDWSDYLCLLTFLAIVAYGFWLAFRIG